jgi:hypothetical protein
LTQEHYQLLEVAEEKEKARAAKEEKNKEEEV